jgi:hypothetical protein
MLPAPYRDQRAVTPSDRPTLVPVGALRTPECTAQVGIDLGDRRRRVEEF